MGVGKVESRGIGGDAAHEVLMRVVPGDGRSSKTPHLVLPDKDEHAEAASGPWADLVGGSRPLASC